MTPSRSSLVLIPSFNAGRILAETVGEAHARWRPVWVVIDGSTDGSDASLSELSIPTDELRVVRLPHNRGKGAAVLAGLELAAAEGFVRVLVMDSDGQHPADRIPLFMATAAANPDAMVLGVPEFGTDAPAFRRRGRRIGNWWANLETFWGGIDDSLFGFRVYPVAQLLALLKRRRTGRRYDFETVAAVRLFWCGVRPINIPVPVRYLTPVEGGVSHFRYWRDNLLLIRRHVVMVLETVLRWPWILRYRRRAISAGGRTAGSRDA